MLSRAVNNLSALRPSLCGWPSCMFADWRFLCRAFVSAPLGESYLYSEPVVLSFRRLRSGTSGEGDVRNAALNVFPKFYSLFVEYVTLRMARLRTCVLSGTECVRMCVYASFNDWMVVTICGQRRIHPCDHIDHGPASPSTQPRCRR